MVTPETRNKICRKKKKKTEKICAYKLKDEEVRQRCLVKVADLMTRIIGWGEETSLE
jgi:hypothetical protein